MNSTLRSSDQATSLDSLRPYAVLDTPPEPAFDDLAELSATVCETPIALISLGDEHRMWFKAKVGLEISEIPREASFCAQALQQTDVFVVPDAALDARFAQHPLVTSEPGIRFYAGAPLITAEGVGLGTLCVLDSVPRALSPAQEHALRMIGRQVMALLQQRLQWQKLRTSEAKLRAIFEAGPDSVKLLSLDATLHQMNAAGLRLIEADNLEALADRSLLPLVVSEDREALRTMLDTVARGEKSTVHFRIVGLKGTPRWVAMSGAPFRDEESGQNLVLGVSRDITESKKAEEALKLSEARFASVFRLNPASISITTLATGRIVEVNERLCEFFGWQRAEVIGKTIDELRIWIDPAQREPLIEKVYAVGSVRDAEVRLRRRNSEERDVLLSMDRVDVPGETEPVLVTMFTDLTARKRAEEALRVSEARYRALFEYAPDGIVIADPGGRYIDANASVCQMLGYTHEEMVGLHTADVVLPAEVEHIGPALSAIQKRAEYHREWQFRRKDGSVFTAEVIATMMPDGNLLGMIRDITERKRVEARFRRLVDSNAQGVMFWNTKGEITGANDAYLRLVGYTREDLEAGRIGWAAVTPPEYADLDRRSLQEIRDNGFCAPYEKEYLRKDGSRVPVLAGATTFEDNPEEGICFALDLTERKKLEQQFLRVQRMESIGTLAGGIAHDLNNVLSPILMSLEVLKMRFPDSSSQELIAIISASAQRGADMVRQVLSFARGVEGRRMEVQIKHLVQEIEKIGNDTFLKHIQIQTILPHDLWTVLGDSTQLHQVLLNLCVNARDAMPEGGALTLSAENLTVDAHYAGLSLNLEAKPGPYVCLQVKDSGIGMRVEVLESIFDPFFTTKEVGKGTGLGLSTSLAIVKSHGGFIRVFSEPGKGTTFKVYLPARTRGSLAETASASAMAELPPGHGELILVVDDEAAVRETTRMTLEAFGYRVLLAADGAEALAIFARPDGEVAAVLIDMMMPVLGGPLTIQVLRKLQPSLCIIAASGLAADGRFAGTSHLGVKHFLTKPFTAGTLLNVLKDALSSKH